MNCIKRYLKWLSPVCVIPWSFRRWAGIMASSKWIIFPLYELYRKFHQAVFFSVDYMKDCINLFLKRLSPVWFLSWSIRRWFGNMASSKWIIFLLYELPITWMIAYMVISRLHEWLYIWLSPNSIKESIKWFFQYWLHERLHKFIS